MIKRLDLNTDELLLREAFAWTAETPRWHRDMDAVFGPDDAGDFLKMCAEPENILIGVFRQHEFVGLIIAACASRDIFNSHLLAKRGADPNTLVEGAHQVTQDFLRMGMEEGFCFIAEKNRSIRRLCSMIGFRHDGIVMYRGTYRGRVIKWLRYSIRPEAVQAEIAA